MKKELTQYHLKNYLSNAERQAIIDQGPVGQMLVVFEERTSGGTVISYPRSEIGNLQQQRFERVAKTAGILIPENPPAEGGVFPRNGRNRFS